MGNTYYKTIYHIVFCIKYRQHFFHQSIRDEVFSLMAFVLKEEDVVPLVVGGYVDHVHLLVSIKPQSSIPDIISKVKTRSNKLLKLKKLVGLDFRWQKGYGIFTVSPFDFSGLKRYIENQEEHHRSKGFKKEFISMLEESDTEYDDNYLFDFLT